MNSSHNTEAATKPTNKRLRDPDEELFPSAPSTKRAKTTGSNGLRPLTAETLRRHTEREGKVNTLELMGSEAGKGLGSRGSKRAASRVGIGDGSIASTGGDPETTSQFTQKSSFTAAHYRNSILKGANIHFQFRQPPEDIRTQITTIIRPEVSPERNEELLLIGQKFHDEFANVLDTAAREDDCVELFYQVLSSMGYNESLALPRKVGMVALLNSYAIYAHFIHRLAAEP